MRILVTGASGFIGKNFLLDKKKKTGDFFAVYNESQNFSAFLKDNGLKNIKPFKCDFSKKDEVLLLSRRIGKHFDAILYLAANGDPAVSFKDPEYDLKSNTANLLNFLRVFTCKKFIYFSSGAVYDGLTGPVSPKKTMVSPTLPYAISKFACENYVRAFQKRYKSIESFIIVRFFGAYGPYEPERKIYTRLVHNFLIEKKSEFTVTGDGKNLIDAMFVGDTVKAVNKIIAGYGKNIILDLATGKPMPINKLVRDAGKVFGYKSVLIRHKRHVPEYIKFYSRDRQFRNLYSFIPQVGFTEGMRRLAGYIKDCK